ncbi:MAG: GH116 family glycosyl-hydrolase, partial [Roseiflexaceae bacterium]
MRNDASRQYGVDATQATFPLGGVGTGNVSIGVRGDLRDWEIYNTPAKGTYLPNTFVALSVQPQGGERVTRV